jgi:hypothetical protein
MLAFTACQYEVPITSNPTRKVEERLLGDWTSADGKEKLKLRRLDDSIYIVYYDGDLFRAYHSDLGTHRSLVSRTSIRTIASMLSWGLEAVR